MWFERDGEGFSHLGNERRARLFLGFIDMNLLLLVTGRERSAEMEMTDSWLRRTFNVNVERHQKSFRINHVSFVKLIEISSRDVHHRGLSSVANWLSTCRTSCPYHGSINFRPRLLLTTLRDWHKLVEKNYRKTFLIFLDGCCSSRSAKRQVVSREVEIKWIRIVWFELRFELRIWIAPLKLIGGDFPIFFFFRLCDFLINVRWWFLPLKA